MANSIDNTQDIIDSRDVIERIEELEDDFDNLDKTELEELETLKALQKEGEDYCSDWSYGEVLIRDSYFKEYAEELANEIGAIDSNVNWPVSCIDWEQAASELQMDYNCIDFDGVDYWIRLT